MGKLRSLLLASALALLGCLGTPTNPPAAHPATSPASPQTVLLDFESPTLPVTWIPAHTPTAPAAPVLASEPATTSASQPSPGTLQRTSLRPQAGLWSLATPLTDSGEIRYVPPKPLDLGAFDILTAQVTDDAPPARNGECLAHLRITDADGQTAEGDPFPVLSDWQPVALDLRKAFQGDIDPSRIASISLVLEPRSSIAPDAALVIKTDTWAAQANEHTYVGSSVGRPRSFFVESRGTTIHAGSVGQYELVIADRGIVASSEPWLTLFAATSPTESPRQVLGQPNTGIYLLDQDALASFPARSTAPNDLPSTAAAPTTAPADAPPRDPRWRWPDSVAHAGAAIEWNVVWAAPVGAIIEGTQEAGGYDRLGEPLLTVRWRLMIYQWGQVFVTAQWTQTGQPDPAFTVPQPVSWALLTMPRTQTQELTAGGDSAAPADAAQRLLTDVYPATFRQGLDTALPHRMQTGAAVAMIGASNPKKDNFWWTRDAGPARPTRELFGTGINTPLPTGSGPISGQSSCMLLVNAPNDLQMAGSFGQYLVPPKIIVNQGELDRNFPGDADNDGFVETYGFQVVRLANGRATFTIYPQERPIFYPPILFTVPAAEREALDLKHSKMLINIDGKQFANPPQFPDGSFLLQVPYVLDRPVNVEAVLVK